MMSHITKVRSFMRKGEGITMENLKYLENVKVREN